MENTSLWVFGYGSLCWNPGFSYKSSKIGHIKDYVRRFWQGNTTHRGIPGKPGRVATLVSENKGTTYGVAFEVEGETALQYLNCREVELGGYKTVFSQFIPRDGPSFPVLLYIATPDSKDWSGPAPLPNIASEIISSSGPTGHNVEYLLRLAEFMRDHIPEGYDEHLLLLEMHVRNIIKEKSMCLETLMGDPPLHRSRHPSTDEPPVGAAGPMVAAVANERRDTFQFSAKVPVKKLRCLNL
ncbi:Glutathione-specific gamma-glutamylcyclotransferase [Trinorchestia longiramus]|nr:Glutathione-specific gamma-glutamylcyclotransferase [Trinorchestia longiramus]